MRIPLLFAITLSLASACRGELTTDPARASFRVGIQEGSSRSLGSATAIGPNLLLTNSHVVSHHLGPAFVVDRRTGRELAGQVVAGDPSADVALIELAPSVDLPYVELGDDDPRPGQPVRTFGYGHAGVLRGGRGERTAARFGVGSPNIFFTSTLAIESGDSGSGVFDDAGRLVGVNWGADGDPRAAVVVGSANFVPVSCVKRFLGNVGGRVSGAARALLGPRAASRAANQAARTQFGGGMSCGPNGCSPMMSGGGGRRLTPLAPGQYDPDPPPPPPAPARPELAVAAPPPVNPALAAPVLPGPDLSEYAKKKDLTDLEERITAKLPPPPDLSGVALKSDIPPPVDLSGVATKNDLAKQADDLLSRITSNQQLVARLEEDAKLLPAKIAEAQASGTHGGVQLAVEAVKQIFNQRIAEAGGGYSYAALVMGALGLGTPIGLALWLATRGTNKALAAIVSLHQQQLQPASGVAGPRPFRPEA